MPFVPSTLKQVREITGCTEEEAARRVQKDVDTIRRWESDAHEELPTLSQAKNLAMLYRYSAGVFLLEELPDFIRVPEIHDFRTLPNGESMDSSSWSRNLRYLMRQMQSRQEFAADAIRRTESSCRAWIGSIEREEIPPEELAEKIRGLLATGCDDLRAIGGIGTVLNGWIHRCEERAGIFVLQTDNTKMPIEIDEMRGLSMADQYAPFIVLNSKESHAGRIFTLIHEFAHLWLGEPGISASSEISFRSRLNSNQLVEHYCDIVAANALMPTEEFLEIWNRGSPYGVIDKVEIVASHFTVSEHAVAARALSLCVIDPDAFSRLRAELATPVRRNGQVDSGSGGNYYAILARNAGANFVDLVLREYTANEITIKEAARLLDTKIPSVFSLADHVGFRL